MASFCELLSAGKGLGSPLNPTFCLEMENISTPEKGAGRRGKGLQGMFVPFPLQLKERLSSIRKGKGDSKQLVAKRGLFWREKGKGVQWKLPDNLASLSATLLATTMSIAHLLFTLAPRVGQKE